MVWGLIFLAVIVVMVIVALILRVKRKSRLEEVRYKGRLSAVKELREYSKYQNFGDK